MRVRSVFLLVLSCGFFVSSLASGQEHNYAKCSFLNDPDRPHAFRGGFELNKSFDTFLNIRYVGGVALSTDKDDPGPGDGYTDNWLHTVAVTVETYFQ